MMIFSISVIKEPNRIRMPTLKVLKIWVLLQWLGIKTY